MSAMLQVLSKAPETYSSLIRLKLKPEGRHNTYYNVMCECCIKCVHKVANDQRYGKISPHW